MAITDWHFGKILILWVIDVVILFMLLSAVSYEEDAFLAWLVLSIPVFVITWEWFRGRERNN